MDRKKIWKLTESAIISLFLLSFVGGVAQAGLFVYQLPNGSRIITDHPLSNKHYTLVRTGQTARGMGMMLASTNRQFFRADPTAYDRLIAKTAKTHKVDQALIKAIVHAESSFNPYATSSKGARGLMQLMPRTAQKYGITDLYDPEENIRAGVRHMKYLLKKFRYKNHLAIAAYNAGASAVIKYRGIPPFKETRAYVKRVLRYKRRYKTSLKIDA